MPNEEKRRVAKSKNYFHSKTFIALVILWISLITVVVASVKTPPACLCYHHIDELQINRVTFGSTPGQVSFWLQNFGTTDVTVVQVFLGSYTSNTVASANAVIRPVSNLTLTVTFSNAIFQTGTEYSFDLLTSYRNVFRTSGTP